MGIWGGRSAAKGTCSYPKSSNGSVTACRCNAGSVTPRKLRLLCHYKFKTVTGSLGKSQNTRDCVICNEKQGFATVSLLTLSLYLSLPQSHSNRVFFALISLCLSPSLTLPLSLILSLSLSLYLHCICVCVHTNTLLYVQIMSKNIKH